MNPHNDIYWMLHAVQIAKSQGTAFGAVIVNHKNEFVDAFNTTKKDSPVAHAEINAIQKLKALTYDAPSQLRLYTTVEPCPMCMSAIIWTGIGEVIYGASIADASQFGRQIHITSKELAQKAWYPILIKGGIEKDACVNLFTKT